MRRIRFLVLGFVTFVAAIFGALLAPGTWVNRVFSTLVCGIFSFNSMVCTANWGQSSQRVVAATPPAVEKTIFDGFGNLLAQRDPSEFGDPQPSTPSPQQSNPQAPPFPQDPGLNFPVRREFDNPDSSQISSCSLTGTWLYSLYANSSDDTFISSVPLNITQNGDQVFIDKSSDTSFQRHQTIGNLVRSGQKSTRTLNLGELTATTTASLDGSTIWGEIREPRSREGVFFVMELKTPCISQSKIFEKENRSNQRKEAKPEEYSKFEMAFANQILNPNNDELGSLSNLVARLSLSGLWNLNRTEFEVNYTDLGRGLVEPHSKGCTATRSTHQEVVTLVQRGSLLDINPIATGISVAGNSIASFREDRYVKEIPALGGNHIYENGQIVNDNLIQGSIKCFANKGQARYGAIATGQFTLTRTSRIQDDPHPVPRSLLTPEQVLQEWKKIPRPIRLSEKQINVAGNVIAAVLAVGLAAAIVYGGPALIAEGATVEEAIGAFLAKSPQLLTRLASFLVAAGVVQPVLASSATIRGVPHKKDDQQLGLQPQQTAQQPQQPEQEVKQCRVRWEDIVANNPPNRPDGTYINRGTCVIRGAVMTEQGLADGTNECGVCNTYYGGLKPKLGSCGSGSLSVMGIRRGVLYCPPNWDSGW